MRLRTLPAALCGALLLLTPAHATTPSYQGASPICPSPIVLRPATPREVLERVDALRSGHLQRRREAIAWVFSHSFEVGDILGQLLAPSEPPEVRLRAAHLLFRLARPAGPDALPHLTRALSDPLPGVRFLAACTLGRCSLVAGPAAPALAERLDDPCPGVRTAAVEALGWIGAEARPHLAALLLHTVRSPDERPQVEAAIERIGGELRRKGRPGVAWVLPVLWWRELSSAVAAAALGLVWARQGHPERRWATWTLPLLPTVGLSLVIASHPSAALWLRGLVLPHAVALGGTAALVTLAGVALAERALGRPDPDA